MRIHIGGDHAAYELKGALVEHLSAQGHDVVDHGPHAYDALDDYDDTQNVFANFELSDQAAAALE